MSDEVANRTNNRSLMPTHDDGHAEISRWEDQPKSPYAEAARALASALADSYGTFLLTQNYHWNVEGPLFKPLHELFEDQYNEMFTAIDEIAERLRAMGFYAPGTFQEFIQLNSIPEFAGTRDGEMMVQNLIRAHRVIVRSFRRTADLAGHVQDLATEDLAIRRIAQHEKMMWMLVSTIGGKPLSDARAH